MPPSQSFSRTRNFLSLITLALVTASGTACRDVGPSFGPTIPAARNNAEQLFGGIAQRFTNVERNPKFQIARGKLGKNALTPSSIFNDTSVWTAMGSDNSRTVTVEGEYGTNRYLFSAKPSITPADEPGDSRHTMILKKVGGEEYSWFTNVEISAGSITGDDMLNVINALMKSAERRNPTAIRVDYRESFPRTTAALGRLFSLDTLRLTNDSDGATTIVLGIKLDPDKLKPTMPAFAKYLDKYATESKYKTVILDKRGVRWIELSGADNLMMLKLRSKDGHFAPLAGAPRPVPNDLTIDSEFTAKILFFNVGFRKLVGNLSLIGGEHERGWFIRYTREPDWKLPPTVGMMIKTPLRRPFESGGITFRLTMLDAPGRQTMLVRKTAATVEESTILRFFNRLSGAAMGDFVGNAEIEENRFSAEAFNAMRLDSRALIR